MIAHIAVSVPTCPHCGAEDLKADATNGAPVVVNCYCCAKDYRLRREVDTYSMYRNYTTEKV